MYFDDMGISSFVGAELRNKGGAGLRYHTTTELLQVFLQEATVIYGHIQIQT